MPAFLLNLRNSDFAEGRGLYRVDAGRGITVISAVMRVLLMLGTAGTLAGAATYFYQAYAKEQLLGSVRTVTARVSGCEGPGRFQKIRFHYTVDGKTYDESAYWRQATILGPSGLTDACVGNTTQLRYLASNPTRWSIAPLSPLTRDEVESGTSPGYLVAGPVFLAIAVIIASTGKALKKRKAREEKLAAHGVILKAELIQAREDNSDDSPDNVRCEYRFKNPCGVELTAERRDFGVA